MATDDSMDDDVFEAIEDSRLKLAARNSERTDKAPSPTGYRNYKPPAEILKLCQSDIIANVEPRIHKTILLGDSGVGKTSLLVKFDTGKFQSGNFSATVGIGFTVMLLGDSGVGKTCILMRFREGLFLCGNFISTVGVDFRTKVVAVDDTKVKLQIWDTAGQERFRSVTHAYYRDAHALLLLYDVTNKTSFDNIRAWLGEIREYAQDDVVIMLLDLAAFSREQDRGEPRPDRDHQFHEKIQKHEDLSEIEDLGRSRGKGEPDEIPGSPTGEASNNEPAYKAGDPAGWCGTKPRISADRQNFQSNKADCGTERAVRREEGERLAREYNVAFMETSAKSGQNVDLAFVAVARELKYRQNGQKDTNTFNVQDYVRQQSEKPQCPPCST